MSQGRLFGDRYKAVIVEGEDRYHYQPPMDYIHLNPVRARIIRPEAGQGVLDYPWSSIAGGSAMPLTKRPKWLAADSGLRAFEPTDTTAGRRRMVERLDRRAVSEEIQNCGVPPLAAEVNARTSHLRRGWHWGTQAFGEAMRRAADAVMRRSRPKARGYQSGPYVARHGEREAEAWLKAGLRAAGLKAGELALLKGSDPRKLMVADPLWRRTVVSQEWLAKELANAQCGECEPATAAAGPPEGAGHAA